MYVKKLFTMLFWATVIFSESRASASDLDEKKDRWMALLTKCEHEAKLAWEKKKTPLTLAASRGDVEQVRSLLENRAEVDEKDGDGMTALMEATSGENIKNKIACQAIVTELIQARADVNMVNNEGKNALMLAFCPSRAQQFCRRAVYDFDQTVVRLLIVANVDVSREDNDNRTVLDYAIDQDSVFDLLTKVYEAPDQESNARWQAKVAAARESRIAHREWLVRKYSGCAE